MSGDLGSRVHVAAHASESGRRKDSTTLVEIVKYCNFYSRFERSSFALSFRMRLFFLTSDFNLLTG
jgi:hypothetical protein